MKPGSIQIQLITSDKPGHQVKSSQISALTIVVKDTPQLTMKNRHQNFQAQKSNQLDPSFQLYLCFSINVLMELLVRCSLNV